MNKEKDELNKNYNTIKNELNKKNKELNDLNEKYKTIEEENEGLKEKYENEEFEEEYKNKIEELNKEHNQNMFFVKRKLYNQGIDLYEI